MNYWVYILYSEKLSKYYVGYTQDIEERLIRHNSGRSKFTSKGMPWELKKSYACSTLSEARKLEKTIKGRGISRYLEQKMKPDESCSR